jgi:hypothetical protein
MLIRIPAGFLLVLACSSAMAGRGEVAINSASELRDWCKSESEAAFIGRGLSPQNWSARYFDEGNDLVVKGQWRVDAGFLTVECRVARGGRGQDASMSLQGP